MPTRDRLTAAVLATVRVLGVLNLLALAVSLPFVVATFALHDRLAAGIAAKYAGRVGPADVLLLVRMLLLLAIPVTIAVHRLFGALAQMLRSVLDGDPFAPANAVRLRMIGWAMLALQLCDVVMGAAIWWAQAKGIETIGWQPALIGWLGVLVAFVLARVFATGTRLRDETEGLV